MPIYAIFEVNENDAWDNSDVDVLVGYVESEEAAKRICDNSEEIAKAKVMQDAVDAWCEKRNAWTRLHKDEFVNPPSTHNYVTQLEKLQRQLASTGKPNLTNIPADRHEIVMAGHYAKIQPIVKQIEDLKRKITMSLDYDAAMAHNRALEAERDALIGTCPPHPKHIYRRTYQEIEKLD